MVVVRVVMEVGLVCLPNRRLVCTAAGEVGSATLVAAATAAAACERVIGMLPRHDRPHAGLRRTMGTLNVRSRLMVLRA